MNWGVSCAANHPASAEVTFADLREALLTSRTPTSPSTSPRRESGVEASRSSTASPRTWRRCGGTPAPPQLAQRRLRQPRRLAGRALSVLPERPDRQRRRRTAAPPPTRGTSGCRARTSRPPHAEALERAHLAARVPAHLLRDELSSCRTSSRRAAATLDVYFTRVYNPLLDQPGRLHLDRRAHATSRRSACTSRSRRPGARRPGSPTTCCRWATAPSGTT